MSIDTELRWILVICGTVLLLGIYFWGRRKNGGDERERRLARSDAPFEAPAVETASAAETFQEPAVEFTETVSVDVSWNDAAAADDLPEIRANDLETREAPQAWREPVMTEPPDSGAGDTPAVPQVEAPTLSEVASPAPAPVQTASPAREQQAGGASKPATQRKIIALRLAAAGRGLPGSELLSLLKAGGLQHGKFGIFHRQHSGGSVFSAASMVEPGSFDLATMAGMQYPGVTLFMMLPGPVEGLTALEQMLAFAQRLKEATHGVLQDERGRPLTQQTLMRLRDEVLQFQRAIGGAAETPA